MQSAEAGSFLRHLLADLEKELPNEMCATVITVPAVLSAPNVELAASNSQLHAHMIAAVQAESETLRRNLPALSKHDLIDALVELWVFDCVLKHGLDPDQLHDIADQYRCN